MSGGGETANWNDVTMRIKKMMGNEEEYRGRRKEGRMDMMRTDRRRMKKKLETNTFGADG
jgi:hypothetical protein